MLPNEAVVSARPTRHGRDLAGSGSRRGLGLALSAPSGSGKTTLAKRLVASDPNADLSISVTTRAPRPNEKDAEDYFFINAEQFTEMRDNGQLLECAAIFDHHYGTSNEFVSPRLAAGRDVIFDVDWQGVLQLRDQLGTDLISVFVMPPSLTALQQRLVRRGQDSESIMAHRMQRALSEIEHWEEADFVILNDDLDDAFDQLTHILHASRLARIRQAWVREFMAKLHAEAKTI